MYLKKTTTTKKQIVETSSIRGTLHFPAQEDNNAFIVSEE